MQVIAVLATRADAAREEEAEGGAGRRVGARVPAVGGDAAAAGGLVLGRLVAVAVGGAGAGPLVVPDVVEGARSGALGLLEGGGVDLRAGGAALLDLDDLLLLGRVGGGEGRGG